MKRSVSMLALAALVAPPAARATTGRHHDGPTERGPLIKPASVAADDAQKVVQIIGGDPAFWSRSLAD